MALSCSVIFLYGTVASLLGTLLPTVSIRFHLSPAQNGYIASLQAVGLTLATLIAGPLMDSKGIKATMIGGLALMLVSLVGLVGASGWGTLVLAIFVLGFGSGTSTAAANNLATQVDERQRASMLSLANVFFGLGGLATPFIAANLLAGNPLRLAYLVAGLSACVLGLALSTYLVATGESGFHIGEVARIERKRLLLLLCATNFLYAGCEVGFWNWLPKYLISRGNDARTALNILGFGFACGMIAGRLITMPLLRRVSAMTACVYASAAMVIATCATIHFGNPVLATIAVFCSGMVMGPVFPSAVGTTGDAFPRMTGTCIGLVITSGWLGAAVSSWMIGRIAGSDPSHVANGLMLIPAFSLVMVFLSLTVKRMLPQTRSLAAQT